MGGAEVPSDPRVASEEAWWGQWTFVPAQWRPQRKQSGGTPGLLAEVQREPWEAWDSSPYQEVDRSTTSVSKGRAWTLPPSESNRVISQVPLEVGSEEVMGEQDQPFSLTPEMSNFDKRKKNLTVLRAKRLFTEKRQSIDVMEDDRDVTII